MIRRNVFETNSSSSHSIIVDEEAKADMLQTMPISKSGTVYIDGVDEFGWGNQRYNDPMTKAIYCFVDTWGKAGKDERLLMLTKVIKEHTGALNVDFSRLTKVLEKDTWAGKPGDIIAKGYIDHQSDGTSLEAFDTKEKLRNFIFSPKSWLFITNDNSGPWPGFYYPDNLISEKRLHLAGSDKSFPLRDLYDKQEVHDHLREYFYSHERHPDYGSGRVEHLNLRTGTFDLCYYRRSTEEEEKQTGDYWVLVETKTKSFQIK